MRLILTACLTLSTFSHCFSMNFDEMTREELLNLTKNQKKKIEYLEFKNYKDIIKNNFTTLISWFKFFFIR